jgi:hypothetical protein
MPKLRFSGPHGARRRTHIAAVDGRTHEGRFLNRTRADLIAAVGSKPTIAQIILIERTSWLLLRAKLMDEKLIRGLNLTDIDDRAYCSWVNSARRNMERLGIVDAAAAHEAQADALRAQFLNDAAD